MIESEQQNTITFNKMPDATWVLRITADCRIEANEDVEVTEAAKAIFEALEPMLRYAAPVRTKDPCHPWQDLTDDEIVELAKQTNGVYYDCDCVFARAVIAADREKNK